ncbi:MAG: acyl-CoA dehydrogenase family protein [Candidatus Berkiella sp.]
MLLKEEHKLIRETARQLANKHITPFAEEWAKKKQFPRAALEPFAQAGFMGVLVPEHLGGAECDYLSYVLFMEEIAKADGGVSTILGVHNSVGTLPLLKYGSEAQKEQFLKPMAQGKLLGAFCLSEPQAGSDAINIQSKAIKQGNHYILNGVKQFITSGDIADIAIVFATTHHQNDKREISAFIVPTHTKGYTVAKLESKMGQHTSNIAQIVLDNVSVPEEYLLGQLGEGYKIALSTLECGRLGIGAQALGMAQKAFEFSLQYAKERESFGKKIFQHQAIQFKLAEMATELEAARQLIHYAASKRDMGHSVIKEAAMAKLFATERAEHVCREAIQILGGYGYLSDFPVERIYRDVRVTSIYEGSSEIQKIVIGKAL